MAMIRKCNPRVLELFARGIENLGGFARVLFTELAFLVRNPCAHHVFCAECLGLSYDEIRIVLQARIVAPGADQLHPALREHFEELRSWHTIRGSALDCAKAEFACLVDLRESICPRIKAKAIHLQPERPFEAGAGPGHSFRGVCHYGTADNCCDNE